MAGVARGTHHCEKLASHQPTLIPCVLTRVAGAESSLFVFDNTQAPGRPSAYTGIVASRKKAEQLTVGTTGSEVDQCAVRCGEIESQSVAASAVLSAAVHTTKLAAM
jgi:hypothetical protein